MTTAPWAPDTPTLLAMGDADAVGGMAHSAVVAAATQDGDTIDLPVISGNLRYDETVTPRVSLSLTTHLLLDPAMSDRLDPRKDCRVGIAVGYIRPDGATDVQPVADLGLRSKTRDRPDDTLTLDCASDEALLLDNAVSTSVTVSAADTTTAITTIIHSALPAATVSADTAAAGAAVSLSILDGDKWDAIADLADRAGPWQVYDDGTRTWHIADRPNTPDTDNVAVILSDGPGGTLVQLTETNDREADWYNRVKVLYEWTDTGGTDHRVAAVADGTGDFAPTTGNVRTYEVRRTVPSTSGEAAASAASLVGRTITRGRTFSLTAPSCYWIRPGHTIRVDETGRSSVHLLVASVTFDLVSGLMDLTTREYATD